MRRTHAAALKATLRLVKPEPDDHSDWVLLGNTCDGAEPSAASAGAESSCAVTVDAMTKCVSSSQSEWSEFCPNVFLHEYAEQPPRFYRTIEECKARFDELLANRGHQLGGITCEPNAGDDGTDRFTIRCGTVQYKSTVGESSWVYKTPGAGIPFIRLVQPDIPGFRKYKNSFLQGYPKGYEPDECTFWGFQDATAMSLKLGDKSGGVTLNERGLFEVRRGSWLKASAANETTWLKE